MVAPTNLGDVPKPPPPAGPESTPAGVPPVATPTPAPGKHLQLGVPNFNCAPDVADQMGSYLRLGAVPDPSIAGQPDAPRATGEDLAAYANVEHLDGHVTEFLDDERRRNGSPDFVSVADRKAESALLHTKGGWRDHSDGNRITTTRGDKVEVIRGNYKLVVLGRQDDPSAGTGWDVSGGHIEGLQIKSSIEWVRTFDGTWKTIEKSEKGDTDVTQHGNSVTRNFGEITDTTTGSENEMRPTFDAEDNFVQMVPAPNPRIKDRTWARIIESYTGSENRRVPIITNETWVEQMKSKTDVHSMSDQTHVRDKMSSSTTVDGAMTNTTLATSMIDTTVAALMVNTTLAAMTNINIGNNANLILGLTENVNIGATVDLTLAAMLQVCVSAALTLHMGPRAEYPLGGVTQLTPQKTDVAGEVTQLSGSHMSLGLNFTALMAEIQLG